MTIVSVFPKPAFNKNLEFGFYEIEGCPKCDTHQVAPCRTCRTYAMLEVSARRSPIDDPNVPDGSGRRFEIVAASQVADSLVVEGCLDRGVFIAAGSDPTEDEITAAIEQYTAWSQRRLAEADASWGQHRKASELDPHAHDAARFLGVTREWMSDTRPKSDCVGCGEAVRPGSIKCKCGFPVDWEKCRRLGMLNAEMEAYAVEEGLIEPRSETSGPMAVPPVVAEAVNKKSRKLDGVVDL